MVENFASMAIISAPEYKIWSINSGLYTVKTGMLTKSSGTHSA
jgi:hypothetical protein